MATYAHETSTEPGGWHADLDDITECHYCSNDFTMDNDGTYNVPFEHDGKGYCKEGCMLAEAMDIGNLIEQALLFAKFYAPKAYTGFFLEKALERYKKHWPAVQQTLQEGL